VAAIRADRERLREETNEAISRLTSALAELRHSVGELTVHHEQALPALIEDALRWERQAVEADAARSARHHAAEASRVEREEVNRAIAETTSRLQYHRAALREWHTRLFLSSETVPDAVKVRLDELDSLARQAAALSEARRRQAQAQTILDDLVAQS